MANPNNFPNIEGSELVSQSWTKLLERDASVKKQFAASEFPEVTAEDVGTPCYREDEQKWYIFTGMGELDTPIWWCPFDEIAAESVAFEPTEEFPTSADTVAEALDFLSKKELPNAIIMPAESSEFVGDNVRVEFPLQKVTSNKNTVHVFFSGVKQSPSSYKLGEGGESVIFNEPPAYGETILIQENATILEYDLMPLEASFVADNETTFKMPIDVVNVRTVQVNVEGKILQHNEYTVNSRDIILNEPVTGNVQITTIYKGQLTAPIENSVGTSQIIDESITKEKLSAESVTEDKLAPASVGSTKIANFSVTESKLADQAVTGTKIAQGTIVMDNLAEEVTANLLGAEKVSAEMLKQGSVNISKLGEDVLEKINEASANVIDASNELKGVVKLASLDEVLEDTGGDKVITSDVFKETLNQMGNLGGGRNIGDIFYTTRSDGYLNGAVECDGSTYFISDYTGEASIGKLLSKGYLPYVNLEEYANTVSLYGSCRCFGWDGESNEEFRVPTLREVYIKTGRALTDNEFIEKLLPNDSDVTSTDPSHFNTVRCRAMVQLFTGAKEVAIKDWKEELQIFTNEKLDDVNRLADQREESINNVADTREEQILAMGAVNIVYWE